MCGLWCTPGATHWPKHFASPPVPTGPDSRAHASAAVAVTTSFSATGSAFTTIANAAAWAAVCVSAYGLRLVCMTVVTTGVVATACMPTLPHATLAYILHCAAAAAAAAAAARSGDRLSAGGKAAIGVGVSFGVLLVAAVCVSCIHFGSFRARRTQQLKGGNG